MQEMHIRKWFVVNSLPVILHTAIYCVILSSRRLASRSESRAGGGKPMPKLSVIGGVVAVLGGVVAALVSIDAGSVVLACGLSLQVAACL